MSEQQTSALSISLDRMSHQIDSLEKVVDKLSLQLTPVLTPGTDKYRHHEADDAGPKAPVLHSIDAMTERLNLLVTELYGLHDRIAI